VSRAWIVWLLVACKSDPGSCSIAADCPGGHCVRGTCSTGRLGDLCEFSLECETGYCVRERCTSGVQGADCKYDHSCDSRLCVGGRCAHHNLGTTCLGDRDCTGSNAQCFHGTCRALGTVGQACDHKADCREDLRCLDDRCVTVDDYHAHLAQLDEARRKRAAAEEARMLAASGVEPDATQVERPTPPPGPGQRVRTVSVRTKGTGFAACRADERLIGGSCKPAATGYPTGFGVDDTVGARWTCEAGFERPVTVFALCMKLP
jgi:hypothetical protein